MASFEEILTRPASENKPPQAFPVGTYHCIVDGPFEAGKSSQKGTDYLRVKFKIVEPQSDVNAIEAAEAQVKGKIITNDYYMTDTASYRINELFFHLGVSEDPETETRGIREMMQLAPNRQVLVVLKHDLSPDGKRRFHRVASTAAV